MLLLLLACAPEPETDKESEPAETTDTSVDTTSDCVPETERCNGVDDDCDGEIDEDTPRTRVAYRDADGDGHGDAETAVNRCSGLEPGIPDGYVADDGDCDDTDAAIHPGAPEDCATGRDDDCDGSLNGRDGDGCAVFYRDEDDDGVGTDESECWCSAAGAFSAGTPGDCDDDDPYHAADCSPEVNAVADARHVAAARYTITFGASTCTTLSSDYGDAASDGGIDLVLECSDDRVLMAPADGAGVADLEATAVGSLTLDYREEYEGAADLTGDGVLDLLVTEQEWEVDVYGDASGDFVVSRVPGPWSLAGTTAAADWVGGGRSGTYEGAAGVLGDIDGDGVNDAAWSLGNPMWGEVDYAPDGASTGTAESLSAWNCITEIMDGGDLNGDGLADVVTVDLGVIAVFESPYDTYQDGDAWLWGGTPSAAGDVDGDGYGDLFVPDGAGVHLLRSPIVSPGEPAADHAWATILADLPATSAELDGDDGRELLLGQSDADRGGIENTGALFVLLAPTSGTIEPSSADRAWYGDAGDGVGRALTPLPDLDGDGSDDVAVSGATGIWVLGEP